MIWLWIGLAVTLGVLAVLGLALTLLHLSLTRRYLGALSRVFQEQPLFIIPRGQPVPGAEDVRFSTSNGLTLVGCYLSTTAPRRKGVILFGLEYGSNRWACVPYCDSLLAEGYDIFSFECRNQGDSDRLEGYEPMQWVTSYEVDDYESALAYLRARPDADPRGIGFFGISRGGGAGLLAASRDPYVRCFVTDGIFATHTTMVPYMRKWVTIYSNRYWLQKTLPTWYYGLFARAGLRRVCQETGVRFPHLEWAMPRLAPRPLLMIHGGADTYIKPEMARALYERARQPKDFWLVEGAKHNLALQVANGEYRRRLLDFFNTHLAGPAPASFQPVVNGARGTGLLVGSH